MSGCGEVEAPPGGWITRSGDVMEVGCHSGSRTWQLMCVGSRWVGPVGVCGYSNGDLIDTHSTLCFLTDIRL